MEMERKNAPENVGLGHLRDRRLGSSDRVKTAEAQNSLKVRNRKNARYSGRGWRNCYKRAIQKNWQIEQDECVFDSWMQS
jgi:hypothetical protein